jgi:hypothetical protein
MGGRRSGRGGLFGSLTRPHTAGLEGGARVASVTAGTLLIGAGLLHISAAGDHTNLPVIMVGFLVVAAAQAGLGGLLLFRRPGLLLVAGGVALTLGALGAWLMSRTAGLPLLPGGHMEPIGFKDGVTVLFEAVTVPALALLASAELDAVRLPSPRLGSQAVALLGAGMFALFVPAFTLGGGEHHSAGEMAGHAHGGGAEARDGHAHDGEQLAQALGGHAHGDGQSSGRRGAGHGDNDHHGGGAGGHPHGRPATAALFSEEQTAHEHEGGGGADSHADHGGAEENSADTPHQHGRDTGDTGPRHEGRHDDDGHGDDDRHRGGGEHRDDAHDEGAHGDDAHAAGHGDSDGNDRSLALESGHGAGDGRGARGPALVFHDQPNEELNGSGHAHAGECDPTAEQRAAADAIVRDVQAELRQYENDPAEALNDGFDYVFGPTDRMLHVVHLERVADPDVLKASEIESFIYYMTDTGFVPIGGMFIMPDYGVAGPEPGGCLTRWHHHGGVIGRWATAGSSPETPEMLHVFTYPGLDPWGHYDGRDLAPLWAPGTWVPSVCRTSGDANDGCLP